VAHKLIDRHMLISVSLLRTQSVSEAKMEYYSSLVQDAGTDSRQVFQIINRFLHRKPKKLYPAFDSSTRLANHFAYFFKLTRCGYTLRVTSQASYSPEYITPTQKKSKSSR
jgi:hypothetical protein